MFKSTTYSKSRGVPQGENSLHFSNSSLPRIRMTIISHKFKEINLQSTVRRMEKQLPFRGIVALQCCSFPHKILVQEAKVLITTSLVTPPAMVNDRRKQTGRNCTTARVINGLLWLEPLVEHEQGEKRNSRSGHLNIGYVIIFNEYLQKFRMKVAYRPTSYLLLSLRMRSRVSSN